MATSTWGLHDPQTGGRLAIVDEKHPSVIIMDLRMPILNGLQFLQLFREAPTLRDTTGAVATCDYFLDNKTTSQFESLGASVRFKPIWIDNLVTLTSGLTAP